MIFCLLFLFLFLFLHAKLVKLFYNEMKKIYFLIIFLFAASVGFSQTIVNQNEEMDNEVFVVMTTNYGDLQSWISNQIEASIYFCR